MNVTIKPLDIDKIVQETVQEIQAEKAGTGSRSERRERRQNEADAHRVKLISQSLAEVEKTMRVVTASSDRLMSMIRDAPKAKGLPTLNGEPAFALWLGRINTDTGGAITLFGDPPRPALYKRLLLYQWQLIPVELFGHLPETFLNELQRLADPTDCAKSIVRALYA